jgi:non-canonical poly(A) RNA polymerase PAPD5/7
LFSGGISSYCLVLMIATFLGAYGLDVRDKNVGALLLDFLELFGKKFDFSRTGISMSSGSFFELSPQYAGKVPLWIDDPLNPGANIGFNSFAMYRVKASFEMAFQTLNPPYSYLSVRSYLGRILSSSESKVAKVRMFLLFLLQCFSFLKQYRYSNPLQLLPPLVRKLVLQDLTGSLNRFCFSKFT